MRVVPERPAALQIVTVLLGFLVGPLSAIRLSAAMTPDSAVVQTVAPFLFALVFAGGAVLWMGLGVAVVVVRGLASFARGRRPDAGAGPRDRLVPPGYRAFGVLGVLAGLGVGVLAGILSDVGVATALAGWTTLGAAYGLGLRTLAHHGYLPFPEPE